MKVEEIVTNQIIEELENGIIPWAKPWISNGSKNLISKKEYRGINMFLLDISARRNKFKSHYWLTFNQAKQLGGNIKKGSKSQIVIYFKILENKKELEDGSIKIEKFPLLRYYNVFNIEQTEGIEHPKEADKKDITPIDRAEKIIKGYEDKPVIEHFGNSAFYSPSADKVVMPPKNSFNGAEEYYSTLYHELVHSTGHKDRLNRRGIKSISGFGSQDYSQEELIAEIGSCFLRAKSNIEVEKVFKNSVAYIQNWLKKLRNDKKLIIVAAAQAQKSTDYIIGQGVE